MYKVAQQHEMNPTSLTITNSSKICRDKHNICLINKSESKQLKVVCTKRWINYKDKMTYPYGY